MKTIDRKTIKQYWKDVHGIRYWTGIGFLLVVVGVISFLIADSQKNTILWDLGWIPLLLGAVALGILAMESKELKERKQSWQYQLLDRWERHSGQSLSM